MTDEHTEIYKRIGNLETQGARMDERQIAFAASHEDIKKGLRAVEATINKIWIKVGFACAGISAIMMLILKFWTTAP
jgi:hypothetical protein